MPSFMSVTLSRMHGSGTAPAGRVTGAPGVIGDFCRGNHIRKVSLFGSALLDDFRPERDVVPLTAGFPSSYFREEALLERLPIHVAA